MNTENDIQPKDITLQSTYTVWQSMKAKFADVIVLVRKDDYYFTFGSDAEIVSKLMGLKMEENSTAKSLCHVHYCYTDKLLQNIVKAGCRIALCDPLCALKK